MPYKFPHNARLFSAVFATFLAATTMTHAAPPSATPQQTAPNMEAGFATPPDGTRPWVYWFVMDGNFTREGITADLESMKRVGIGGVIWMEVNVGVPRGPVAFMSPPWKKLFAHAVHECERLGLQMTTNAGPGWTGTGGPWITPKESMQHLVGAPLNVSGPRHVDEVLPRPARRPWFFGDGQLPPALEKAKDDFYRDVAVLAFPAPTGNARTADIDEKALYVRPPATSQPGTKPFLPSPSHFPTLPAGETVDSRQVVDLTAKLGADGHLDWEVPAGNWTIVRFGTTSTGAPTRPAPDPGLGLESNKFEKADLEAQFKGFVQPLLAEVGPRKTTATSGWNMLHIDSWEMGAQNWSDHFRTEFTRRRGYDPLRYWPALTGLIVDSPEVTERFLWDWRETANELLVENHAGYLKTLGKQYGFGLSIEPYDMNPSSDMNLGTVADVPMGEFWLYGFDSTSSVFEAVSTGHTNGRPIIGAESFTSDQGEAWRAYPGAMKELGDWALSSGINRFVIHRSQHQPALNKFPGMTMGPYGVHWERTQTWWDMVPAYHRYLARCQFLLRRGLPVSDVCYLVPEGAPQVFHAPSSALRGGTTTNGRSAAPTHLGYNFDGCAPTVVLHKMTVKNGRITLPDGMSYGVLVLPERDTMTPALLRKITQLVAAGATVIGPRPRTSPSLADRGNGDAQVEQLAQTLWGNCDGLNVTDHAYGKGHVIWKRDMDAERTATEGHPWNTAQWIWYPEGNPSQSAPVAQRYFRRALTLDDAKQISSARVYVTADNGFGFYINGRLAQSGDNFRKVYSFDAAPFLKTGANLLRVTATNGTDTPEHPTPNPAGMIATLRIRWRDGHTQDVITDASWESALASQGAAWHAAQEVGNYTAGPWNLSAQMPQQQYGDFAIATNALQRRGIAPDFASSVPVRFTHRREGTTDIYFVANEAERAVNASCTFRVAGKAPELWNPQTGERRALPLFSINNGLTTVPLRFEPFESWFVVFKPSTAANAVRTTPAQSNFPTFSTLSTLTGAWDVAFDPKWGGPAHVTFSTLEDWSQRPESGIRFYSGKATYRKTLTLPLMRKKTRLFLDLGTVKNLARVKLNGCDLGVVWCAPWRVELTNAMHPGANHLEIEVANLWPNRLIGDQAVPPAQRLTSTTWDFYSKADALLPSGLLGPVTVKAADF